MAGYLDGEGCIRLFNGGKYFTPRVAIENTYYAGLVEIQKEFGGRLSVVRRAKGNWRTAWRWEFAATEEVRKFLLNILPYLREKKPQALVMLEALDLPSTEREWHYNELKRLKHIESTDDAPPLRC